MVTVNRSLTAQAPGDLRWLRVEDPSAAAACRGAALALAARLGFPAPRADELALAVTEAGKGTVALKPTKAAGKPTGINPNGGRTTGATNDGRKMSPWSL